MSFDDRRASVTSRRSAATHDVHTMFDDVHKSVVSVLVHCHPPCPLSDQDESVDFEDIRNYVRQRPEGSQHITHHLQFVFSDLKSTASGSSKSGRDRSLRGRKQPSIDFGILSTTYDKQARL
jgi:hypothetical protein